MAALAPPLVRDNFVYHDQLYVDTGNLNRHPRASIAELTALLRPEAAKTKKSAKASDVTPAKDPPGHFYTAQLIHYGLPSSNVKHTAKVRLLNALNAGTLEVPFGVKAVEEQMKKEYLAANRKAKAVAKKGTGAAAQSSASSSSSVQLNVTVNVDRSKGKAKVTMEENKTMPATTKPKSPAKTIATTKGPAADRKPTKSTVAANKVKGPTTPASSVKPTGVIKTSAKSTSSKKRSGVASAVDNYLSKAGKLEETLAKGPREKSKAKFKPVQKTSVSEATDMPLGPPPAYSKYAAQDDDSSILPEAEGLRHVLEGLYHLDVTDLDDDYVNYDVDGYTLRIYFDNTTTTLWGRFHCAQYTGIIRIDNLSDIISPRSDIRFNWRAENSETGQLRFGRACTGVLWATDDGSLQGRFDEFFGQRDIGFNVDRVGSAGEHFNGEAVRGLAREWNGYPHRAYGR